MICKVELSKGNIPCENVSYLFYQSECDVLSLLKSGYITEFEVKISRSDFKADARKSKWKFFDNRIETGIPNYFYYACKEGLISKDEIQDYAGLVHVDKKGCHVVKKAKRLHSHKKDIIKVLRKFCRIKSERKYFGSCLMTHQNNKLKSEQ